MYESPINIIRGQIETHLEGEILKAVQRVGVNVSEEELLKALQYDRDQYRKGFADGKSDAVVHGRWIKDEIESKKHEKYVEAIYICSSCKNFEAWGEVEKTSFQFCPNCGADMRERESNG